MRIIAVLFTALLLLALAFVGLNYGVHKLASKIAGKNSEYYSAIKRPPQLSEEVVNALDNPSSVILYSLQASKVPDLPEWNFHGYHQLGHIEFGQEQAKQAIGELKSAVSETEQNPHEVCCPATYRHALRVVSEGHTYDFLLCYHCGELQILRDDHPIMLNGWMDGYPKVFDELLTSAMIPLPNTPAALNDSYVEEAKQALRRAEQGDKQAQEVIGKFLISGAGVKKNEAEGLKWLDKASVGKSANDLKPTPYQPSAETAKP